MPTFQDSDNKPQRKIIPEQDAIFCVTNWATSISKGRNTSGADVLELELEFEGSAAGGVAFENLIDAPRCIWRIDTFLKSAGVQIKKGQSFSWGPKPDGALGTYIDPIGLRGWCRVGVETYVPKSAACDASGKPLPGQEKQRNKVITFYTDKQKLPPNEALVKAAEEEEERPF